MNTYPTIEVHSGSWAMERFAHSTSQGYTLGRYEDQAAALDIANE
jgi:hypothetical protein